VKLLDPSAVASLPLDESCVVCAGPGTGKTRLLVNRIEFLLRNARRPGSEIACITYTNAAADEIASRLARGTRPAFIGTIHSFLLENVVYPYASWLEGVQADFDLVTTGYASPLLRRMVHEGLVSSRKSHIPDIVKAFESAGRDLGGTIRSHGHAALTQEELKAFVDLRLASNQINQQDVLWFAWRILSEKSFEHVLDALACRFSAILVDEFQDTSALQFAVLDLLHEKRLTSLFLVGDKEQSIFSFAGASLETYEKAVAKFPVHRLSVNHRSTSRIVALLNSLLEPTRRLEPGSRWKDEDIPVYVLVGKTDWADKVSRFKELRRKHGLDGGGKKPDYLILARGRDTTRRLSLISKTELEEGEDVFERLDEKHRQLCSILRNIVGARRLLDLGEDALAFRSLDRGLSRLVLKANPGLGRPEVVGLTRQSWRWMLCIVLGEMQLLNAEGIVPWTKSVQEAIKKAILEAGGKKSGQKLVLLGNLQKNLKKSATYLTTDAFKCVDLADDVSSAVRTIHRAKGLEAESVLLVAKTGQLAQWLNNYASGKPRTEMSRIGYVGLSRAMRLLCVASDTITAGDRTTLEGLGVVVLEPTHLARPNSQLGK
jgi:ATP-dependent DNA helicase UvrD/PcrA